MRANCHTARPSFFLYLRKINKFRLGILLAFPLVGNGGEPFTVVAAGAKNQVRERRGHRMGLNCWEYKKCGREPGGKKAGELGVCPAATNADLDGVHGGKNGGRSCWVVAGSLCGGTIQGSYAQKLSNCWKCEFMNAVKKEEEQSVFGFSHTRLGIDRTLERQKGKTIQGTKDAGALLVAK